MKTYKPVRDLKTDEEKQEFFLEILELKRRGGSLLKWFPICITSPKSHLFKYALSKEETDRDEVFYFRGLPRLDKMENLKTGIFYASGCCFAWEEFIKTRSDTALKTIENIPFIVFQRTNKLWTVLVTHRILALLGLGTDKTIEPHPLEAFSDFEKWFSVEDLSRTLRFCKVYSEQMYFQNLEHRLRGISSFQVHYEKLNALFEQEYGEPKKKAAIKRHF